MKKYIPQIGDVVRDNGIPVVVIAEKNYETYWSCSYDREYLVVEEQFLKENQGNIEITKLKQHGRWISVKGTNFPDIERLNIAPYVIEPVEYYHIRQKNKDNKNSDCI